MPTIHAALHKIVVTNDNQAHIEVTDLGDYPSGATISIDPNEIFGLGVQDAKIVTSQFLSGNVSVRSNTICQ